MAKKKAKDSREMNPNSLANLILWLPGQSGNPSGKKKGTRDRRTVINAVLEHSIKLDILPGDDEGKEKLRRIIEGFGLDPEDIDVEVLLTLSVVIKGIINGDAYVLEKVREWKYGKTLPVPDESTEEFHTKQIFQIGDSSIEF